MKNTLSYKKTERRQLAAMALLEQGWSGLEVARHFGVTSGAVSQWKKAYQRYGPDGLKATIMKRLEIYSKINKNRNDVSIENTCYLCFEVNLKKCFSMKTLQLSHFIQKINNIY